MRSSTLCVGLLVVTLGFFAGTLHAQTLNNPDFEDWTNDNPDGWGIGETVANEVRQDPFAYSGDSSCKFNCLSLTRPRVSQTVDVQEGEEIALEVFAYDNDPSYLRAYLKVYNSGGTLLVQDFQQSINLASWQALNLELIAPVGTDYAKLEIIHYFNTSNPGPQANYLDLASITVGTPTYAKLKNPGFEDWTGTEPDSWTVVETGDDEVQQEGTIVNSGVFSASMTSLSFTRPRLVQLIWVRPGDTVSGSAAFLDDDPSLVRLYLRAYDSNDLVVAQSFVSAVNDPSWQVVTANLTTPTSTAYVRYEVIQFWNNANPIPQTVYVDDGDFQVSTYTYDVSNANTWYFMGIPVDIDLAADRNADALFSDDLGGNSTESTWVMSRWNNTTAIYERFGNGDGDPFTEPPDIEPGLGYWFVQNVEPGVPNPKLDVTSSQTSTGAPESNVSQTITGFTGGSNGTTQLANPFYGDYTVSTSNLTVSGSPVSWGTNGINANIYTWDGAQYLVQVATSAKLESWEGFWVVKTTAGDADIQFVYDPDQHGPEIDELDEYYARGWSTQLSVASLDGLYLDTYNELGVRSVSQDGYDGYDGFELTPPSSHYVSLAFTHPDWQEGHRFAHDYRDLDFDEDTWSFEVKATRCQGESFRLTWPTLPNLPGNVDLELFRLDANGPHPIGNLRDVDHYDFTVGNQQTETVRFYIHAYDNNRSSGVKDDQAALPTEFGILSAYPNPFNAQIAIKLGVPETSIVSLKIFDILGREVARLNSTELSGGEHTFVWNADDHASGIYVLKLETGGNTDYRKVTLLR